MSLEFLNQFGETVTTILAFLIFAWVLKKFAWEAIVGILDERKRQIEDGFERIERKQADAAQLEQQYAARLRDIELEARAKIQEGIAEGRRVAAELTEHAREESSRIIERAQHSIQLEIGKARHELRDELVAMTIGASERLLREKLDERGHRRLVGSFIDELEKQPLS